MGFCHESYGPNQISVEERSESFYIHAGYGYGRAILPLRELRPGDSFFTDSDTWKIRALYEDHVEAESHQFGTRQQFHLDCEVEVLGTEAFDETVPLAKRWANNIHPEIELSDLPHLLTALADLEACPPNVREAILARL